MRIELIVCEKKNHVYKIKDLQVFGKMRETHIRIVNREHLVKLNFDIFLITLKSFQSTCYLMPLRVVNL